MFRNLMVWLVDIVAYSGSKAIDLAWPEDDDCDCKTQHGEVAR